MRSQRRRLSAFAVSSVFIVTQVLGIASSTRPAEARARFDWSSQRAPLHLVPERTPGPRGTPMMVKPEPAHAVRRAQGIHVEGPRMLRPAELRHVMNAAAPLRSPLTSFRTLKPLVHVTTRTVQTVTTCPSGFGTTSLVTGGTTVRRGMAVQPPGATPTPAPTPCTAKTPPPPTPSPMPMEGTGIKRWWSFRDTDVQGGPHAKTNMSTGNLLLQGSDQSVPHKGVPFDFVRTYNSESIHDLHGSDGFSAALYGNGWTNTLDAHLTGGIAAGTISVYDVDGARYDYTYTGSDAAPWTPPPGQNASLVSDGSCGYLWTRRDGSVLYFWRPDENLTKCAASFAQYGGFAGRLSQIIGRNRNNVVTLSYAWDAGNASPAGKVSQIVARTESGLTMTLNFGDVGSYRLLYQLIRPDNTSLSYSYDAAGDLVQVLHPANNAAGTVRYESYGFRQQTGGSLVMYWAAGARYIGAYVASGGIRTDGGFLVFTFSTGTTNELTRLTEVDHVGFMNPNLGAAGQTYPSSVPTGMMTYLSEYYTPTPPGVHSDSEYVSDVMSDTDGHWSEYTVDGQYRAITTVRKAGAQYLSSAVHWDASNDMVASIDPRGYETDYFYDYAGDVTAIAAPPLSSRPTRLFDYDAFGNVTAYCDETETRAAGAEWAGNGTWGPLGPPPPQYTPGSSTLCSSYAGSVAHWTASYAYPSYEPAGELVSVTTPTGYVRTIAYNAAYQGGADYGLATLVSGQSITQRDSTGRVPARSAAYDVHGNVVCSSADAADASTTTVVVYDAMNRVTAVGDPDDSSLPTPAGCAKTSNLPGTHAIVSRTTYYSDGSVQTQQSPDEAAANASSRYVYDLDGNTTSFTTNYANVTSTTTQYFDSAERLVAIAHPLSLIGSGSSLGAGRSQGPTDQPWVERHLYDLSGGGSVTTLSGQTLTAHGNLYEVTKTAGGAYAQLDVQMAAFDMLNRVTTTYAFAPCPWTGHYGAIICSNAPYATNYVYDASAQTTGLLASQTDGLGQTKTYAYDSWANVSAIQYGGDGGVTPAMTYAYDEQGRLSTATAAGIGTQTYSYAPMGGVQSVQEPALLGSGTKSYAYYADSSLAAVTVNEPKLYNPNMYQYSYRNDGNLVHETFGNGGGVTGATIAYGYSGGGRLTGMWDFATSPSRTQQYDASGRVASYSIPSGTYSNLAYDAEGDLAGYVGYNGVTVGNVWNNRGELVGESFSPNPIANGYTAWPAFAWDSFQGTVVRAGAMAWDARTGAPIQIDTGTFTYDAVGRVTQAANPAASSTFKYDAENRLLSGSSSAVMDTGTCGSGLVTPGTNRNLGYTYGPDGHVVQDVFVDPAQAQHTRQWHWALDTLAYTATDSRVDAMNADDAGVIPPSGTSPGLTVYDRDSYGLVTSKHNVTGHDAWTAPNPYLAPCVSQNPPPASPGYVAPFGGIQVPSSGETDDGSNVTDSSSRSVSATSSTYLTPTAASSTPYAATRHLLYTQRSCPSGTHAIEGGQCVDDNPSGGPSNSGGGSWGAPNLPWIGGVKGKPAKPKKPQPPPRPVPIIHSLPPIMQRSCWTPAGSQYMPPGCYHERPQDVHFRCQQFGVVVGLGGLLLPEYKGLKALLVAIGIGEGSAVVGDICEADGNARSGTYPMPMW